jgi:hypothetical protein
MGVQESIGIDLIRELRLRQWARTHYVTESERSVKWHPIVLEEMRRRDEELFEGGGQPLATSSQFVPLDPGAIFYAEAS